MKWAVQSRFGEPRFRQMRDNPSSGRKSSEKFFEFWKNIKPELVDVAKVKVYRLMPAIDVKIVDPQKLDVTIDVLYGACPIDPTDSYCDWFAEKYGAGEYECILNEEGVSGAIMLALFTASTDYDRYPPKLDLRTLKRGVHKNQSYEEWLKRNNIPVPWEEDEDDMAGGGAEALKTVTDAVVDMSTRNMELADKVAEARIQAAEESSRNPDAHDQGVTAAISLVTTTAESMMKMVTDNAGKQYDPVEMLKAASEIMNKGGGDDSDKWLTMTRMMLDQQEKSFERAIATQERQTKLLESLVLERRQNGDPSQGAVATQPKSTLEQLRELKETADLLWPRANGNGNGNGGGDDKGPHVEKVGWGELFLQNLDKIMPAAASITTALVWAIRSGSGPAAAPANQPVPPGQPGPQQFTPQPPMPGAPPAQPMNGMPGHAPMNTDQAQQLQRFLGDMEGPFLAHFFPENANAYNGYTLAEHVLGEGNGAGITQGGRRVYMFITQQLGPKRFDELIRSHQPIWSKVMGLQKRYAEFLQEFFTYDQWAAAQDNDGDGPAQTPTSNVVIDFKAPPNEAYPSMEA